MNVEPAPSKKKSLADYLKEKFLFALRLTDEPRVKLYNGYGNKTHCIVFGHVFSFGPVSRKRYRKNFISNTLALLRLFMVRPVKGATVQFIWEGNVHTTQTASDGFFRFEWQPSIPLQPGWHSVKVQWLHKKKGTVLSVGEALIAIPFYNQFAFVLKPIQFEVPIHGLELISRPVLF